MWIWRSQRAASSVSCVTTTRVMPLLSVQPEQDVFDQAAGHGVEVAGRLVREDELGVVHERAGDHRTLLLTTREAHGLALGLVGHLQLVQHRHPPCPPFATTHAGDLQRQDDVLQDAGVRIEEELLEDEPEGLVAESADLAGAEGCDIHSPDTQRSVVGLIEERQQVHQRGLAGSALPDDRDGLPVIDPEGHALQRVEPVGTTTVGTAKVMDVEKRGGAFGAHRSTSAGLTGTGTVRRVVDGCEHSTASTIAPTTGRKTQKMCPQLEPESRSRRTVTASVGSRTASCQTGVSVGALKAVPSTGGKCRHGEGGEGGADEHGEEDPPPELGPARRAGEVGVAAEAADGWIAGSVMRCAFRMMGGGNAEVLLRGRPGRCGSARRSRCASATLITTLPRLRPVSTYRCA